MITRLIASDKDIRALASSLYDNAVHYDAEHIDYSKVMVKKPWGYEYLIFSNQDVAVWVLSMHGGAKTSLHAHPRKKTGLIVLAGDARVSTFSSAHEVTCGHGCMIEKGVFHSTEALSPEGTMVMEIETPIYKSDLVRLADAYGRSGKGYEGLEHHETRHAALGHFHEKSNRYHSEKQFGDCMLTIVRPENKQHFDTLRQRHAPHAVMVLDGGFLNERDERILEKGDCASADELSSDRSFVMHPATELLFIKKIV